MNLVEMLMKQFGGDALNGLAGLVGGSTNDTQKAVSAAVPSLLAALSGLVSTPSGGEKLMNTLRDAGSSELDLDSILKGGSGKAEEVTKRGNSMLEGLLGKGALVALIAALGKFLGSSGIITKLLPMLAPLVLSMITRQMKSSGGGFDLGSLTKLLLGQKANIASAMPAGLSSALSGIQGLGDFGGLVKDVAGTATSAAGAAGRAATAAGRTAAAAAEEAASPFSKLLPLILGALALAALAWWLFGRGGEAKVEDVKKTAGAAGTRALEGAGKVANEVSKTVEGAADKAVDVLDAAGTKVMGGMKDWFTGMTSAIEDIKDSDTAQAASGKLEEM
ncbi:MAG: DUF937 domain-containing protein, partial [Planctomycetaceae bacterium]